MSKYDKLVQSILNNPAHVAFEDLDKVLKREGCQCRKPTRGSHYNYTRDDLDGILTVPRPHKRPHVGKAYVEKVVEWLGLEDTNDDDSD